MILPFLNRAEELGRISRQLKKRGSSFICLYGRRRCGKSRLVREALARRLAAYYTGDDREQALQLRDAAREISRLIPGFARVEYPGWAELFERFEKDAPSGATLVLDEFPSMVAASPALPSLLQKFIDRLAEGNLNVIVLGSSQRMMQGALLEPSAPLYGRADEILKIEPLEPGWIMPALKPANAEQAVRHYAVWGGVPRYWELAAERGSLERAVVDLVLSPLGVLHREPERLLRDDLRDTRQAASILALIGKGCRRMSEIAGRLQRPATSLSRPLRVLMDMGLVAREVPFGRTTKDTKRSLYKIADPFLRFWYRFVEGHRARLEAGQAQIVWDEQRVAWSHHLASSWEEMVRRSVARAPVLGQRWKPASKWWGGGLDGKPMELNLVAGAVGNTEKLLVGEVKLQSDLRKAKETLARLEKRASLLPAARGKRVSCCLWVLRMRSKRRPANLFGAEQVME